jgi:hypothetical protein
MRTHRWILAAPVVCALAACQHSWDWRQPPRGVPEEDDCKQYSVKESIAFYEQFLPPRGYYQIYALPEPANEASDQAMLPYTFVVLRVRDSRYPDKKDPVVERIIGPVRGKEEMTDLFSILRRYGSSPPAGFYCWQNDCRGKYSPAGDPDPRDPYPPEIPDHAGISTSAGYAVTPVPSGAYILRDGPARSRGTGGSGLEPATGGSGCNFVPRDTTVLTADVLEKLRASASGVGKALDAVPAVPDSPPRYPPPYPQPPYQPPYKDK